MPVYLGIAWSQTLHAACFLADTGTILTRLTLAHDADGLAKVDTTRRQLGIALSDCWVGLETAHTLLIDFFGARGYTHIFVIPPNAVKSARQRYRVVAKSGERQGTCKVLRKGKFGEKRPPYLIR